MCNNLCQIYKKIAKYLRSINRCILCIDLNCNSAPCLLGWTRLFNVSRQGLYLFTSGEAIPWTALSHNSFAAVREKALINPFSTFYSARSIFYHHSLQILKTLSYSVKYVSKSILLQALIFLLYFYSFYSH